MTGLDRIREQAPELGRADPVAWLRRKPIVGMCIPPELANVEKPLAAKLLNVHPDL